MSVLLYIVRYIIIISMSISPCTLCYADKEVIIIELETHSLLL